MPGYGGAAGAAARASLPSSSILIIISLPLLRAGGIELLRSLSQTIAPVGQRSTAPPASQGRSARSSLTATPLATLMSPGAASGTHLPQAVHATAQTASSAVIPVDEVPALDQQLLIQRHDGEQLLGAGVHAVAAGGAPARGPPPAGRSSLIVDRVERAGARAVGEAQAAPGASLAAARHGRGGARRSPMPRYSALPRGHIAAAGAEQPGHPRRRGAGVHAEEARRSRRGRRRSRRCTRPAAPLPSPLPRRTRGIRIAAGAAIRVGQHAGHVVDPGILPDLQLAVGERDHGRRKQTPTPPRMAAEVRTMALEVMSDSRQVRPAQQPGRESSTA